MPSPARNVADLVRASAHRGPQHVALVDVATRTSFTWSELDAAADAEARRLTAAGLRPGDRVVVRLPTGPEFCAAVFGVLRAGGVLVPAGPGQPERELGRLLADSGARLLVGDGGGADVDTLPAPALAPGEAGGEPFEAVTGGEDLAVLSYTSGTSGVPRGVMLSHRALLANVAQCAALRPAPVTAGDRVLLALPLFHVYGLGPGLFQVAGAGATAVLLERFDPDAALDAVREHRVTALAGVPPMYRALLTRPIEKLREDLATVRLFTSGAAPLPAAVQAAVRQAVGLPVYEGYGLTETGPVLTSTLVGGLPKPGSVGRPLPGVRVRLVDSDGRPLDVDEDEPGTGLVAAKGDNLFSGYWPDGAHGPDADGWFRTGDVGYLDEDGDLHLVDRAGDLIIVNGFNVYPHEVERVVGELDGVAEVAAVGVPDERTGEAVKVVLVLEEGAELTEERVREHCAQRLAKFKVPAVVEFAQVLPHSPTGKLARALLR
ncbi:AMP-binding protein [Saccharothrix coeruleofusca]|uniref:Long-chain acyl-CoA synthetase n=1 Tax=Saccharothrix coeruleofusca TaxID=33919 RepID=A0A918AMM9_9PSEU|nr:AMP-binding protein [Saccharothrix coeruleofusca]MBP2339527.1 long-chain acyl-CoA synthetase [Saccharothrix coeruleofusca]GGP57060.1 long-chain acyl-CoA synthetase [Saccharothrix coeruleofusca]